MVPRFYRLLRYTPGSDLRPVAEISKASPVQSAYEKLQGDSPEELYSRLNQILPIVTREKKKTEKMENLQQHSAYVTEGKVKTDISKFQINPFLNFHHATGSLVKTRWLFAYDASLEAEKSWKRAKAVATLFHADLAGIYIQNHSEDLPGLPEGVECIPSKKPGQAILEYLHSKDFSLLWMGTHARKGKERVKRGSVAETLLKEAQCPVWVEKGEGRKISNILLPFEDLKNLESLLRQAMMLSHVFHAKLYLLHVTVKNEKQKMNELVSKLGLQTEFEDIEKSGEVLDEILKTVQDKKIDLLVMATHFESASEQMLPSGYTVEVMREAPCPLFVLKYS